MVSVCIPVGRFVCHSNRLLLQTMRGRDLLHYSHKICANIEDCKSKAKWHPRGNHPATDTAGAIPKNHLPENTLFGKVVRVGVCVFVTHVAMALRAFAKIFYEGFVVGVGDAVSACVTRVQQ